MINDMPLKKQFTREARLIGGTPFTVNGRMTDRLPSKQIPIEVVTVSDLAYTRSVVEMFFKTVDEDAAPMIYTRFAA